MIDRANFRRLNANYEMPRIKRETQDGGIPVPLGPNGVNDPSEQYYDDDVTSSFDTPVDRGVLTLSVQANTAVKSIEQELSEEELLLTSPVLYGFSLSDKIWRKQPPRSYSGNLLICLVQLSTTSKMSRKSYGTRRHSQIWCYQQVGRLYCGPL